MSLIDAKSSVDLKRLSKLLDAVLSVGSDLDLNATLRHVVESASNLVDAKYGALGVLNESRTSLAEFVVTGLSSKQITHIGNIPTGVGVLGELMRDNKPIRVADITKHPKSIGVPSGHPQMKTFLGVPITIRDHVFGNLYLTDRKDGQPFSETDEAVVVALSKAAAIAIENAKLHSRVREMTLSEDRERIARELHDVVIQRLFATGLSLQSVSRIITPPEANQRVEDAISDLDDTITQIRTSIFALENTNKNGGLRNEILDIAKQAQRILGFEPSVTFHGALESTLSASQQSDITAVIREGVSNAARHAKASTLQISISVDDKNVTIGISDNGRGFDTNQRSAGLGLRNLYARACDLGGMLTVCSEVSSGTSLTWTIPRVSDVDYILGPKQASGSP